MRALAATVLAVFALALAPTARSEGEPPVSIAQLLLLAEAGAGEALLENLIADRGVRAPVTVEDVLTLKRAGFSDDLVAAVLGAADGEAPAAGVTYREEDGVLVVEGRGEPDPAGSPGSPPPPPWPAADPPAPTSSHVVVVAEEEPEPAPPNPYPVGATFGLSGGAVFLPARFGESPSAFGRTIIHTGPGTFGLGCVSPCFPAAPAGVLSVPAAPGSFTLQNGHGTGRTIGIRTSRGVRQVPN